MTREESVTIPRSLFERMAAVYWGRPSEAKDDVTPPPQVGSPRPKELSMADFEGLISRSATWEPTGILAAEKALKANRPPAGGGGMTSHAK